MDVTYNFTAGTRAVAQQVNQNFSDVKSAVDPLETAVANIESQLTSGIILPDGSVDFTRLQSYATYVVSNATNATPIVITAVGHNFLTGDKVYISGVGGNTAANGVFTITKIGVDTFSLDGSVGNGAFTSNGAAVIYPSTDDNLTSKTYVDSGDLKTIVQIGTSTTAAATAEKAVTLSGFVLAAGATLLVSCSNANTAATPTLNVNSTGAKALKFKDGIAVDATHPSPINLANRKMLVIYNGTDYIIQENSIYDSGFFSVSANTTYTKSHNLGTSNISYKVLFADDANGTNQRRTMSVTDMGGGSSTAWTGYYQGAVTNSSITLTTAGLVALAITNAGLTTGYYRILAERL